MTDLSKGIIEIDGIEISPKTTLNTVSESLNKSCSSCVNSKNGKVSIFTFKNITIKNRHFNIDVTFINKRLSDITLYSRFEGALGYEERFHDDCDWLKSVLGEPNEISNDGNSYYFEGLHIYSFIQLDLSRNPAETYIVCKYNG